jgi:hypothetical protein
VVLPGFTDTVTVVLGPRKGVLVPSYTQESKDQIIGLHRQGRTFMELAKEFNLSPTSIANWVRAEDRRRARLTSSGPRAGVRRGEDSPVGERWFRVGISRSHQDVIPCLRVRR